MQAINSTVPCWPAFPGQSRELFHYSGIHQDNKPQIFFSAASDDVAACELEGRERRRECFPRAERNQTCAFGFRLHALFAMSCHVLSDWVSREGNFLWCKIQPEIAQVCRGQDLNVCLMFFCRIC